MTEYYEQVYDNISNNLNKIEKFLEKHNLHKLA